MSFTRFVLLWLACGVVVYATSVRPPEFDELVGGSELIFRGRVTAVESGWQGEGGNRHLATRVTFAVERALKGTADNAITLEFIGGHANGRRSKVVGLPEFAPGDRAVCFVEDRAGKLCPLRRLRHGRYRVVAEAGTGIERVLRDDGQPLANVAAVRTPLAESAIRSAAVRLSEALTLPSFEQQITQHVQARETRVAP